MMAKARTKSFAQTWFIPWQKSQVKLIFKKLRKSIEVSLEQAYTFLHE